MNQTILISFIIYSIFFLMLENCIFRINSEGVSKFNIMPLFTEGFIGPLRSLGLLIIHGSIKSIFAFLFFELFRLSNPFSAFIFVYYITKIIKYNFI